MALQGLALERQRHAGRPLIGLAHHRAERVDALAGGVFAGCLEIGGGIGRRVDERGGWHHHVAGVLGREFAFALRERGARGENDRCDGSKKSRAHMRLLLAEAVICGSRVAVL
jgi:hypothetical protein